MLEGRDKPDDAPAFCERGLSGQEAQRMIRTAEWKYCIYGEGRRELFCLAKDPGETKNLADDPAYDKQVAALAAQLREWMQRTGDPALKDLFP
jgi:arylsulfatase A-like enzyme